jgi:hypothetical protein
VKKRALLIGAVLGFLLIGSNAFAQTPTLIDVNKPFTLAWDNPAPVPNASPVTGNVVELNGQQIQPDLAPSATSKAFAGIATCGAAQTIRVGARWSGGIVWSAPVSFQIVNCPPGAPTNLRIVIAAP